MTKRRISATLTTAAGLLLVLMSLQCGGSGRTVEASADGGDDAADADPTSPIYCTSNGRVNAPRSTDDDAGITLCKPGEICGVIAPNYVCCVEHEDIPATCGRGPRS